MIWLLGVIVVGIWVNWYFVRQLYTAAMLGYILTGVPEVRVYREENPRLFRNNVIGAIAIFPWVSGGAMVLLLDALEAVGL